jgi:Cdc6-like AAA superfamily ATPase
MSTVNNRKPEVSICKEILWRQLNSNSDLAHLSKEENQIKSRLKDAFDRRVSTSILVVGPTGSGKRELVEKVMIDYCSEGINSSNPISVARINGLVHLNDNQVR